MRRSRSRTASVITARLADRAYDAIKQAIIRCELRPGEGVSEAELASRFGFGLAPVRAALARLVQEGLARPIARRGHEIAPITMKRIQDTFAVRVLLEAEAARLAAGRVNIERLRELDALCSAGYDPHDPESVSHYLRINTEIHVAVARASGNERLASTLSQLLDDMERIFHFALKLRDQSIQIRHEHRAMVDALDLGDGAKAAEITAEQVLAGQRMVTSALHATPQLMSINLEVPA